MSDFRKPNLYAEDKIVTVNLMADLIRNSGVSYTSEKLARVHRSSMAPLAAVSESQQRASIP